MGKRYHLLSEEALAVLFVSHLPVERMPEALSKRVQERVLATVNELKHTKPTEPDGRRLVEDRVAQWRVLRRH